MTKQQLIKEIAGEYTTKASGGPYDGKLIFSDPMSRYCTIVSSVEEAQEKVSLLVRKVEEAYAGFQRNELAASDFFTIYKNWLGKVKNFNALIHIINESK